MNKALAIAVVALTIALSACQRTASEAAQSSGEQTYRAVGVIKKISVDSSQITVDHDEIAGYMPAMEMTVSVAEPSSLTAARVGDKIEFELSRGGSDLMITKMTKIGEVIVAAEIYSKNCAECHGHKGEGAKMGIPLTSGHALHHTREEHIKQVTEGEGKKMPAFRDKLSAEEIAAVVDFVRNDLQKDATRDASTKHKH